MSNSPSQSKNQQIVLAKHPDGIPTKDTFQINDIDMPVVKTGEVLIKSLYVSVDPGMRGFMDKGDDDAAGNKFELNQPITSRTVAQIISESDATTESKGFKNAISSMAVLLGKSIKASV